MLHDRKRIKKYSMTNVLPESIHIRFTKYTLGVNKSDVNSAVLSETGRFPVALSVIK